MQYETETGTYDVAFRSEGDSVLVRIGLTAGDRIKTASVQQVEIHETETVTATAKRHGHVIFFAYPGMTNPYPWQSWVVYLPHWARIMLISNFVMVADGTVYLIPVIVVFPPPPIVDVTTTTTTTTGPSCSASQGACASSADCCTGAGMCNAGKCCAGAGSSAGNATQCCSGLSFVGGACKNP